MLLLWRGTDEDPPVAATFNHYRRYCDLADVLKDGLVSVGPLFITAPPPHRQREPRSDRVSG